MRLIRSVRAFLSQYPCCVSWVILSGGMTVLTLWAAQDRGLSAGQLAWLIVACVGLAGVCAWVLDLE